MLYAISQGSRWPFFFPLLILDSNFFFLRWLYILVDGRVRTVYFFPLTVTGWNVFCLTFSFLIFHHNFFPYLSGLYMGRGRGSLCVCFFFQFFFFPFYQHVGSMGGLGSYSAKVFIEYVGSGFCFLQWMGTVGSMSTKKGESSVINVQRQKPTYQFNHPCLFACSGEGAMPLR